MYKVNGHNLQELRNLLNKITQNQQTKPTLIVADTTIAKGSYSEGSHKTHGSPLPEQEKHNTLKNFELDSDKAFELPKEIQNHFQRNFSQLRERASQWEKTLEMKLKDSKYKENFDSYFSTASLERLPHISWNKDKPLATRNAFGKNNKRLGTYSKKPNGRKLT